ncbi:hypothetical protein [Nostoc sp. 'Peltigera malacea cyanobiont' DB3992]|nr:hypothetical protein [Nostoc sp. 'Peltigera malacea cyanobiont' DB3992]
MSNQQEPENLAHDNERSLQTLVRAITLSHETFSLILLAVTMLIYVSTW